MFSQTDAPAVDLMDHMDHMDLFVGHLFGVTSELRNTFGFSPHTTFRFDVTLKKKETNKNFH